MKKILLGIGILLIVFTIGLANGGLRERAQRDANVGAEIMIRPLGSFSLSSPDALRMPRSLESEFEKIPPSTNTWAMSIKT